MRFVFYKWLDEHMPQILNDAEVVGRWDANAGIVVAYGDKFYGYSDKFAEHGIHFAHGAAIGLLSYCAPYSQEARRTPNGWVPVGEWIVNNYERFKHLLPPVDETNPKYCSKY